MLKRNLSAVVRIGKRTRAIRIQRNVRVWLAKRELQRRKEAFSIRYAQDELLVAGFSPPFGIGRRGGEELPLDGNISCTGHWGPVFANLPSQKYIRCGRYGCRASTAHGRSLVSMFSHPLTRSRFFTFYKGE